MKFAPIALFVYNRPEHTRQAVEALLRNPLAAQSELFIFSDAAKTPDIQDRVEQVRAYVRSVDGFKSVQVIEREKNHGLANSIIDGVTKLCDDYGRVIVLEDDLVVAPTFLNYMNEALAKYQDNEKVMQISGYMFPINPLPMNSALFLPFVTSWGWATWKRAWRYFDPMSSAYKILEQDRDLRYRFDMNGNYPYFKMLTAQLNNEVDSWAIRWNLSIFMRQGLILYPSQSFVRNEGFDGTGIHCADIEIEQPALQAYQYLQFPSEVAIDKNGQKAVHDYFSLRKNSWKKRLKTLIMKIFIRN